MRLTLPIAALAAGAFGIGTTEFIIMGLLPQVASDLSVSIPAAGLIVTGYALGVVVGSPLLAVLMARWPRKASLLALIGLFIAGNIACAVAPTYGLLMAARVVTAFSHGSFFAVAAIVAAELAPPRERAQAIALMFAGLSVANIIGVPLGTIVGQSLGWRMSFFGVAGLGLIAMAGIALAVPRNLARFSGSVVGEFRVLRNPRTLVTFAMSTAITTCLFSLFTYVTPLLTGVTGLSPHAVAIVLVLYGVGITVGTLGGGRLADWRLLGSLGGLFMGAAALLVVMPWLLPVAWLAVPVLIVWAGMLFAICPGLQLRTALTAGEAPNLAPALNQSAFNLGCASGAWLGGVPIAMGLPLTVLPLVSIVPALVGVGLVALSARLDRRRPDAEPAMLPLLRQAA